MRPALAVYIQYSCFIDHYIFAGVTSCLPLTTPPLPAPGLSPPSPLSASFKGGSRESERVEVSEESE